MFEWHNVKADGVHAAVARMFELSNTLDWSPSEFYIACKMITSFLELQYGCVWVDEEKFLDQLKDYRGSPS